MKIKNEKWKMRNGKWKIEASQKSEVRGQRSVLAHWSSLIGKCSFQDARRFKGCVKD